MKNYLLTHFYWGLGLWNPHLAIDNLLALIKHPLLYASVHLKVDGMIDHFVGTLLYDNVLKNNNHLGHIIEVGAYKGLSTCYLSLAAKKVNKRVKSFELFSGLPTADPVADKDFRIGQFASAPEEYRKNLKQSGRPEIVDLTIGDARETMKLDSFSIAFLDVDIGEIMRDLLFKLNMVAGGGEIIIIHDTHQAGVRRAVDDFLTNTKHKVIKRSLHRGTVSILQFS